MADKRNRTPFYGAVPTSKLQADHVFMADGSTLQEQADRKYELIEEITLTEDVTSIVRNEYPDGTKYKLKGVIIKCINARGAANADALFNVSFDANTAMTKYIQSFISSADVCNVVSEAIDSYGYWRFTPYTGSRAGSAANPLNVDSYPIGYINDIMEYDDTTYPEITEISLTPVSGNILADSVIKIYGIKA